MTVGSKQPVNPFDRGLAAAEEYDAWYDSPDGRVVLEAELRCMRELLDAAPRPWLDLGTGSGRFGQHLGADLGLDPAPALLSLAASRLPSAVRGIAESLPIRDASVGAVCAVTVFEFLPRPARALQEVARVLRPGGRFVLGFIPGAGAWADAYRRHGQDPDSVFHGARFYSASDLAAAGRSAGLQPGDARSALFEAPGAAPSGAITHGADASAGFTALAFERPERDG